MRKNRYSQFFQWLIILLSLFVSACDNNLEEKLTFIEQRILDETIFGRQMRDYIKSKNTSYILDQNLSFQARYSTDISTEGLDRRQHQRSVVMS